MQDASAASLGALGTLTLPRICFGLLLWGFFFFLWVLVMLHEPFGGSSQMSLEQSKDGSTLQSCPVSGVGRNSSVWRQP